MSHHCSLGFLACFSCISFILTLLSPDFFLLHHTVVFNSSISIWFVPLLTNTFTLGFPNACNAPTSPYPTENHPLWLDNFCSSFKWFLCLSWKSLFFFLPLLGGTFPNVVLYCWCCWATKLCPTFCDPMDFSMPGFPVSHHLLELAQVHVRCISDAVQPFHPLSPSSPSASSQHWGLFQWVGSLHQVVKVLELRFPHQSFQWVFRLDFL